MAPNRARFKSDIVKYIFVLMSGTVIAQVFAYLLAPIITRLYTPEESAEMGLYVRIIGIGATIATARYELALPIIKSHVHSFRIYKFSTRIISFVVLGSFIMIIAPAILSDNFSTLLFYLMIPLGIYLLAFSNLGTNWSIRNKSFRVISYSRISNSLMSNLSKVGFGLFNFGYIGLILGVVVGLALSSVFFFVDFAKFQKHYSIKSKSLRNYVLAKQFSEFPKINLPHNLMDLGRDVLIVFIIWQVFSQSDYGLYNHSYQMLRIPLVLAGASIGQVFFQKSAEMYNKGEDILKIAKKSVLVLFLISIVPFSIIFFYGEEMFAYVFGEDWRGAGIYSEIMAPWFMVNFVSSPISTLPLVLRRQKSFFILAIIGSVVLVLSLLIPGYFLKMTIEDTLWITSILQTIYLLFVILVIFRYIKTNNDKENI